MRIRALREGLGYRRIEGWAAAIGCSASKARMIEENVGDVRLSIALNILRALGRTAADLETILRDGAA